MVFALAFVFTGCEKNESDGSSNLIEIIEEEELIIEGDNTVSNNSVVSSDVSSEKDNDKKPTSSDQSSTPSADDSSVVNNQVNNEKDEEINIDYEWKSHSQDYKLLAFTFDDGPHYLMSNYIKYFAEFEGAGTFFINGYRIAGDADYAKMQEAINYGWDIGNHGDNHLNALTGGANGAEATYDELKADIHGLSSKLEAKLKFRDGSQYKISTYRPPYIKTTENTFKICMEENLAVIWLSHDSLDWGSNTKQDSFDVFKNGVGTWKDGDIILCHVTSQNTYDIIEELLTEYYKAGYRFCSITELMELRGIKLNQISGELNNIDGNNGMVTNIIDASKHGKK